MSTPILTELAAPVIAMAQAHCTYLDTMRQTDTADANRAALVAFKRALKEVDVPAPTLTIPPTEMPANDMAQLEHRTRMRGELLNGLARAINETSTENASNTPDFILANFAAACLDAFAEASLAREVWYSKSLSIGGHHDSVSTAHDALIAEARELADEVDALASAGHDEICRVCKNPPRNFTMSIPVREDVDTDRIIGRTVSGAHRACDSLRRLADALTAEHAARVKDCEHAEKLAAAFDAANRLCETWKVEAEENADLIVKAWAERDAAIARAERAEAERAETAGSLIRCRQTFSQELDTLRTQLAEAQEELARAVEFIDELLPYVDAYFRDKWKMDERRATFGVLPAKESSDV